MPWWAGKKQIREYLERLNEEEKVGHLFLSSRSILNSTHYRS